MFPRDLAEGAFSLQPDKEACALSVWVVLDPVGGIADCGVVCSTVRCQRLTYDALEETLAVPGDPESPLHQLSQVWPFSPPLSPTPLPSFHTPPPLSPLPPQIQPMHSPLPCLVDWRTLCRCRGVRMGLPLHSLNQVWPLLAASCFRSAPCLLDRWTVFGFHDKGVGGHSCLVMKTPTKYAEQIPHLLTCASKLSTAPAGGPAAKGLPYAAGRRAHLHARLRGSGAARREPCAPCVPYHGEPGRVGGPHAGVRAHDHGQRGGCQDRC